MRELRQHASRYLWRVRSGQSFQITDRGRPVARLVPTAPADGVALSEGLADMRDDASALGDSVLRSLDAIHLASARRLGSDLRAVVTYDLRMQEAAAALHLPVAAPR